MHFDLVGIKRSWHSTEDGFVKVGVERVSVTYRYSARTEYMKMKICWAKKKKKMDDKERKDLKVSG